MTTVTAESGGAEESHPQSEETHQEQQQQQDHPSDAVSLAESTTDTLLPDYTANSPRLPSYARATARQAMTEEERLASLHAFVERKQSINDYYGGHKGCPQGPPNDPLKPFKWIKRKMNGEKNVWRSLSDEEKRKWEESGGDIDEDSGEVAHGDIDTSRLV